MKRISLRTASVRATVLALAIACGVAGCGSGSKPMRTVNMDASWAVTYSSVRDLKTHADLVVQGRITKVLGQSVVKTSYVTTDFEFTVSAAVQDAKGLVAKNGGALRVHQTGGILNNVRYQIHDDPLLNVGDESVLFLREYKPGFFMIIGGPTGRFGVKNGQVSTVGDGGVKASGPVNTFIANVKGS
ncbi:MAG: hypothetical protein QOE54_279 [Streptosporangiaceae bacterium]|jgi:hypothetical protein|nr:hypothetical protein [Streptosporangiaceae bacterium]MDX6427913.1 hypothetical protein [Streptosporangiaceae bacterium]